MKFRRCPKTYVTEDVGFWIKSYRMFKNGMLINEGGWLQNPNKYIEMMLYIDDLMSIKREA